MAAKQFVDKGKPSVSARESQRRAAAETTHPLLRLQGLIGNQALLRMIQATAAGDQSSAGRAEREVSRSGPITDMDIKRGPETMDNKSREPKVEIKQCNDQFLARFPAPADCHTFKPGLSYIAPIIKEGYDGTTYTVIKDGWCMDSWERRWQIYDAGDNLMYESYYTWPAPTLYIPQDVIARGKAGGAQKPWSVWIKVTKTLAPFGGSDSANFPHSFMKFYVYNTWNEFLKDPDANLSDQPPPPGQIPFSSGAASAGRSIVDYGSVVAMHEAYLREIYDKSAKAIAITAKNLVENGAPQKDVAKWAVTARNELKSTIRAQGNPILKTVFEKRNLGKYGNKLGPTYEQLYQKYLKEGLAPEEINRRIIFGSGKANLKVNRWSGRLKVAGRIMIVLDIALAGVQVYLAPEGQKTQVALEELARIGGALTLGAAGAKGGAAAGAAIGALFGGAGAVPGAIIGGIIGGIGGALLGGWLGQSIGKKIYEMFPPADCVFEGEFSEADPNP